MPPLKCIKLALKEVIIQFFLLSTYNFFIVIGKTVCVCVWMLMASSGTP